MESEKKNLCKCGCGTLVTNLFARGHCKRIDGKHTEETKEKIKKFMSGPNNPNRGRKHTEEFKKRISEAKTGRKWSEKERIAHNKRFERQKQEKESQRKPCKCGCGELAEYGNDFIFTHHHRVRSEETINKMSESHIGHTTWNTGLTASNDDRILSGEKHGRWNGGVNPIDNAVRTCTKYIEWRDSIYERDDYTCTMCLERGVRLEVHHIKYFHDIMVNNNITSLSEAENCSDLWDKENGITLCKECHKSKHY